MDEQKLKELLENLTPEQKAGIKKFQQQMAMYRAFVLPFRKLFHGTKLIHQGILGVAIMPFYITMMLAAMVGGFLFAGGWAIVLPLGTGAALAYYLPYSNVANTAIAAAWVVGLFLIGQLVIAARNDG